MKIWLSDLLRIKLSKRVPHDKDSGQRLRRHASPGEDACYGRWVVHWATTIRELPIVAKHATDYVVYADDIVGRDQLLNKTFLW